MYLSGGPGGPFSDKVGRARGTTDEGHIYTMQMLIENTNFEYITAEDGPLKIELRDKLQGIPEAINEQQEIRNPVMEKFILDY
jgi:hypothetical protein